MSNTALTPQIYYTAEGFNNTNADIPAQQTTQLTYPLIQNGETQNFQLAIAKGRFPLSEIPMTNNNIPLKAYQLILRNGNLEASAYVRQIGALSGDFVYNLEGNSISQYSYNNSSITPISSVNYSTICTYIFNFVIDDFLNVYIAGSNTNSLNADTLFIVSSGSSPTLVSSIPFNNITSIYIDRSQKFYLIDVNESITTAYIYNNFNGLNNVVLTLQGTITTDFAGIPLENTVFIVASDTPACIIIGHDQNIITYYTNQLAPITDYQLPLGYQLTAANVLNSTGTLIVADVNQSIDTVLGTLASGVVQDLQSDTPVTQGSPSIVSPLAISSVGYGFCISETTNNTYGIEMPPSLPAPAQTPFLINNSTQLKTISSNKQAFYGINTSDQMMVFNMDLTAEPSNTWFTFSNTIVPGFSDMGGITSFDYDINNDLMYASGGTILKRSDIPVLPINIISIGQNNLAVQTIGFSNNNIVETTFSSHLLHYSDNQFNKQVSSCCYYPLENIFITGEPGSQQITTVNSIDCDYTININYTIAGSSTILQIATSVENTHWLILDNLKQLKAIVPLTETVAYTLDLSEYTNVYQFQSIQAEVVAIAADNQILIYNYYTGDLLYAANVTAIATINIKQIQVDTGINTIFCLSDISETASVLIKIYFNNDYTGIYSQVLLYTDSTNARLASIQYQQTFGYLLYTQVGENIYSQVNNILLRSNNFTTDYTYVFPAVLNPYNFYVLPFTDNTIGWTTVTITNADPPTILSLAVSRTNINQIYIVNGSDNYTYMGTINSNQINFKKISSIPVNYISTYKNSNSSLLSSLKTFNINNQTQIAINPIDTGIIQSIGRSEETGTFIVPFNTSQINVYNSSLVLQYQKPLANATIIFVKNGDDINIPNVPIYDMEILIQAINLAFLVAYTSLTGQGGTLAEAPVMSIDTNGYLTLNYSTDYSQSANGILFNKSLISLCYFTNIPDSKDAGFYKLLFPGSSTSITQKSKSIFNFNQLDKILIGSSTLFINGSWYGANSLSQILCDIDIPTDGFSLGNIGQVLYYQANPPRFFQMASGGSTLNTIDLSIYYRYRNGYQAILPIAPMEAWTAKLQFSKKF